MLLFFFFFQAEDGIRDWSVTGVQTCALPILMMDGTIRARDNLWFLLTHLFHYFTFLVTWLDTHTEERHHCGLEDTPSLLNMLSPESGLHFDFSDRKSVV